MCTVLLLQTSGTMRPVVRKKAALCLLRLMRKTPADSQMVTADSFATIMAQLLEERDLGMLLCCVTLLLGICARCGSGELQPWQLPVASADHACFLCWQAGWRRPLHSISSSCLWDARSAERLTYTPCVHNRVLARAAGYEQCQGKLLRLLERLVYLREITPDYTYYGIASPWLQTKVLRALQYFPLPEGTGAQKQLHDALQAIFNGECSGCSSTAWATVGMRNRCQMQGSNQAGDDANVSQAH